MKDVNFSRIFHQLVSDGVINGSSVKHLLKMCLVMIFHLKIEESCFTVMNDQQQMKC